MGESDVFFFPLLFFAFFMNNSLLLLLVFLRGHRYYTCSNSLVNEISILLERYSRLLRVIGQSQYGPLPR